MSTFQMAPGAMVIPTTDHAGLDRVNRGAALVAGVLMAAIRALDLWREARIEAHNDAMLCELAAHDPRVRAELQTARDRIGA